MLLGLLVLLMMGALIVLLWARDPAAWGTIMTEGSWGRCLICIPVFAVIPFGALIWALRKTAPTYLTLTRALIGVVAGALGAAGTAIHQGGQSCSFTILGYGDRSCGALF